MMTEKFNKGEDGLKKIIIFAKIKTNGKAI